MKKLYIQPELLIVRTTHQLPLCISENGAPLYETPATTEGFVKQNWGSFWDEWAGAAGD